MRFSSRLLLAASLLAASIAETACTGGLFQERSPFRFTASVFRPGTRTSYSGEGTSHGGVLSSERIDWTVGDLIRIYSPEAALPDAGNVHFYDYQIVEHLDYPGGLDGVDPLVSHAGISSGSGSGLYTTEENTYHFYAVYPSPATSGMPSGAAFHDGDLTGVIPSAQTVSRKNSGSYVYLPNMRLAYMTASQTVIITEECPDVPLSFYPKFSSFEFTVSSGEFNSVTLRSMSLTSTTGYLTGTFNIAQDDFGPTESAIADADVTGGGREISVDFGASGITVLKDHPVSICVIALAQSVGGLRVTFTGDEIGARSLALKKGDGSDISFGPWRKHRILGLHFPAVADAVLIDPIIWDGEYRSDAFGDAIAWDRSASFDAAIPGGDRINWMEERGLCGPFGGLYLSKGYLTRTSDGFTLSGNDQLEILKYYGEDITGNVIHYHEWQEIAPVTIDTFSVPDLDQWRMIMGYNYEGGATILRPGATVNGESGKHYAIVTVDLTGSIYESYGFSGYNTINGVLLLPDGVYINCVDLTEFDNPTNWQTVHLAEENDPAFTLPNVITYDQLLSLCDTDKGCAFLPCAGERYKNEYYTSENTYLEAGIVAGYWSSTKLYDNRPGPAYSTDFTVMAASEMFDYPVRMVID